MNSELIESSYKPAAMKALESFPIDALDITFIDVSENVTFKVSAYGGKSDYVLRLHRPGYNTIEELESERMWTKALKTAGIVVQEAVRVDHGQKHYVPITIPGLDEERYAGVTTWLEGTPLSDVLEAGADGATRDRLFHRIGKIIATIHNQSSHWKAPSGFIRRRLDADNLLGPDPFWGRFWEHEDLTQAEREFLFRERDNLHAVLSAYGERPDNFSLIHADLTPENIICNEDDLAVIDFDDSAYGWHMYDIAAALIDYRFEHDFDTLRAALLDGYQEHRSLTPKDLDMLPVFLLIRGMAIIGWFHQRAEHSGWDHFERLKNWVIAECDSKDHKL